MTSALEGGGSRKVDKSTDKLRDHVCDKGEGVKKFEIFMDVIDGSPLRRNVFQPLLAQLLLGVVIESQQLPRLVNNSKLHLYPVNPGLNLQVRQIG